MEIRSSLVAFASFVLTGFVVTNAFYQKQQFYPSVVYLTKSSPSLAVLYIQAFVFVILFGKVVQKLLFGQLRAAESEHLMEKTWYAITETCLAFTVFRDDFSPKFVAQFTLLLFLKCFHWLAEDRVDYMERSPVITLLFHVRMMTVVAILSAMDSFYVSHAYFTTLLKGASSQIVFGFEYAILLTVVFHIALKYILHSIDLRNVHPWDNKAVYLLYTELVIGFIRVVLYSIFMAVMMRLHTFPLFSIRPMYLTLRAFKKACKDALMSRRAINFMNNVYPDATAEELRQGDNVCIICREEMTGGGAKKLPCNHIFHASCLRSWFQRQQTCPTCRMDILRMTPSTPNFQQQQNIRQPGAPVAPAAGQPNQAQNAQNNAGQAPNQNQPQNPPFRGMPSLPHMFPMVPSGLFPNAQQLQQQQQQNQNGANAASTSTDQQPSTSTAPSMMPFMGTTPPPFFGLPPFFMPFPPPPSFNGLADEEVRRMEGTERRAVEARINCLRNIQTLLDAAAVQLQQYTTILTTLTASPQFQDNNESTSAAQNVRFDIGSTTNDSAGAGAETPSPDKATSSTGGASSRTDPYDEVRQRRLQHFQSRSANNETDGN